jgi:hypothetical protein
MTLSLSTRDREFWARIGHLIHDPLFFFTLFLFLLHFLFHEGKSVGSFSDYLDKINHYDCNCHHFEFCPSYLPY